MMTDRQLLAIVESNEALRLAIRATKTDAMLQYYVTEDIDNPGEFTSRFDENAPGSSFDRSDGLAASVLAHAKTRNAGK
jgi:hypothetical protein